MPLRASLAAVLALTGSPALAAPSNDCLSYEIGQGGSPVIQAMVQGHGPLAFVLDTASSGTTVDEKTAERLGLSRDAKTETAQGMGGAMDVKFHRVATLTAGPLALTDFSAPAIAAPSLDSHDIVGLAGVDLFGATLAVWNAAPGCVTIVATGARPGQDEWRLVAIQWIRPWKIMLPVQIGHIKGWGLLDTGAQHTVLNPAFADRLGLTEGTGRLADGGVISGIDGRPLSLSVTQVDDVAVGEWRWDRRTLRIGDLPVFSRLGDPEAPLAIIGADWLAEQSFAIDYGAKAVWQHTPSSVASAGAIKR